MLNGTIVLSTTRGAGLHIFQIMNILDFSCVCLSSGSEESYLQLSAVWKAIGKKTFELEFSEEDTTFKPIKIFF